MAFAISLSIHIAQYALYVNTVIYPNIYCFRGDSVYKRIRDLREDRDLTQKHIAEYLRCSQRVYSNYEHGERDIPTHILIALAKFHKTSTDYLLGITENPNPYENGHTDRKLRGERQP